MKSNDNRQFKPNRKVKLMDYRLKGIPSPSEMEVEIPGSSYNNDQDFSTSMKKPTSRVLTTSRQTSSRGSLKQIKPKMIKKKVKVESNNKKSKECLKVNGKKGVKEDNKLIIKKRLELLNLDEENEEKENNMRKEKKKKAKAILLVSDS